MSENDILDTPIGTKDRPTLEPKVVVVKSVEVRSPKEGSKAQIVVFSCEHPDSMKLLGLETIEISQVKLENPKTHKMEAVGLWVNLDEDGNLLKNSTLSIFLKFIGANNLKDVVGKKLQTVQRENNFLAFKGY